MVSTLDSHASDCRFKTQWNWNICSHSHSSITIMFVNIKNPSFIYLLIHLLPLEFFSAAATPTSSKMSKLSLFTVFSMSTPTPLPQRLYYASGRAGQSWHFASRRHRSPHYPCSHLYTTHKRQPIGQRVRFGHTPVINTVQTSQSLRLFPLWPWN